MVGTVEWKEEDRNRVWERFSWPGTPNTQQIVNAQEDLWVYEALVRIIRNTNEGATAQYNATVKEIHALQIGARAVLSWQNAEGSVLGVEKAAGMSGDSDEGARYVDDEGKLLSPEATPPYAEFKMMPIYMKLDIVQTKIPKLLTECANSDMPVEVRNVRLNPGTGTAIDLTRLAGNETTGPVSIVPPETTPATSVVIPVEIEGIICIYNPPDRETLGTGAAGEEASEAAAAEAAAVPAGESEPAPPPAQPATPAPGQ